VRPARLAIILALISGLAFAATQYSIEVMDGFGRAVRIIKAPKKVVSLSDTSTEMIYAIGSGRLLAGISEDSAYPPETSAVRKIPLIEGEFDPAALRDLAPDLIVACRRSQKINLAPEFLGRTYLINPRTMGDVLKAMVDFGRITANEKEATEAARRLKDRMDRVVARLKDSRTKTGIVLVDSEAAICAGDKSLEGDLLTAAGVRNLVRGVEYGSIGWDDISSANPEVIIAAGAKATPEAIQEKLKVPGGEVRIISMPAERISRPGPRLFDGLEELARKIHPEAFK
jgi:iron complex transport system substrate-binding protein